MQDSLEDYLKISKNKEEEECKRNDEKVLITLQRKKECDERAFKLVEFLIDGQLRPEIFIRCLRYINQSHYQDIVEERALNKLCGYPICGKKIPEMLKKQYHISTKSNKIYDITDRKNYCSNFCYKASIHIKKQIETSPLWTRRIDEVPDFKLLPATEKGVPGEEIDQGIVKIEHKPNKSFTSVSSFTEISLDVIIENEIINEPTEKKKIIKRKSNLKSNMQTVNEVEEEIDDETKEEIKDEIKEIDGETKEEIKGETKEEIDSETKEEINDEIKDSINEIDNKNKVINSNEIQKVEKRNENELNKSRITQEKQTLQEEPQDILKHLKKCVKEWLTLDTCMYLHGEKVVKEILNERKLSDYFERLQINNFQLEQQMKYIALCRKLHLKELADEKFDKSILNSKLKPLPDYKDLKGESKKLDLKVRSFYGGILHKNDDSNVSSKVCEENQQMQEETEDTAPAVLPLFENTSQNAIRRKIFLNSANRVINTFKHNLHINYTSSVADISGLAKTFKFQSHNVVFKPAVWNLIGVILLKIISIKDETLRMELEETSSKEYLKLITNPYPDFYETVNEILDLLKYVDKFVENYLLLDENIKP